MEYVAYFLGALLIVLEIIDWKSTSFILANDGRELHPIYRLLIENLGIQNAGYIKLGLAVVALGLPFIFPGPAWFVALLWGICDGALIFVLVKYNIPAYLRLKNKS